MRFAKPQSFSHGFAASGTSALQSVSRNGSFTFGDAKFFDGIGELRIDHGPGYRIYFVKRENTVIILLCGGDKRTQNKDIKCAIEMAKEV